MTGTTKGGDTNNVTLTVNAQTITKSDLKDMINDLVMENIST